MSFIFDGLNDLVEVNSRVIRRNKVDNGFAVGKLRQVAKING